MDAIECASCGYTISKSERLCPQCGARAPRPSAALGTAVGMVMGFIALGTSAVINLQTEASIAEPLDMPALFCDPAAAESVQASTRQMGTWEETDGAITLHWGPEWDRALRHERLEMIGAFADSVACLTGEYREIDFYRLGTPVGKASPHSGRHLVE